VIEGCEPRSFFAGSDTVGGSLSELTRYLLQLGCTDAVALDSGGSSDIIFGGTSLVRPADRNDVPLAAAKRLLPGGWFVYPS
jgi:phosphodiester glycosidase